MWVLWRLIVWSGFVSFCVPSTYVSIWCWVDISCFCCSIVKLCCAAAFQASLSFTISRSLLKLMSFESEMPTNQLILCCLLLLLPSVFASIRAFCGELALYIRWPKYWSFSFSISPFNEYLGLISFREINWTSPWCAIEMNLPWRTLCSCLLSLVMMPWSRLFWLIALRINLDPQGFLRALLGSIRLG